jgi:hypothetical protein
MPHAIPRPWTPADLKKMRALAEQGLSSRLAAVKLRRTRGAVAFKAMNEGIRFRSIAQPAGVQRKPAQRRKLSRIRKARAV